MGCIQHHLLPSGKARICVDLILTDKRFYWEVTVRHYECSFGRVNDRMQVECNQYRTFQIASLNACQRYTYKDKQRVNLNDAFSRSQFFQLIRLYSHWLHAIHNIQQTRRISDLFIYTLKIVASTYFLHKRNQFSTTLKYLCVPRLIYGLKLVLACTDLRIRHGRLLLRKHAQEAYLHHAASGHMTFLPGDLKDEGNHLLLA